MNEQEFIKELGKRANEQRRIKKGLLFANVFRTVSFWFGNHPWRIIIPVSLLTTVLNHLIFGKRYDEFILKLFGKL